MFTKKKSIKQRFWEKVDKRGDNDCWEWTARRDKDGYGRFEYTHGNSQLAHRVMWQLLNGDIPDGMLICHHCDNPPCVNPNHLFLGTVADNIRDMCRKNRQRGVGIKGEDHKDSKLTETQVLEIRSKYKPRKYSIYRLAKEYGIHPSGIHNIIIRRTWRHI